MRDSLDPNPEFRFFFIKKGIKERIKNGTIESLESLLESIDDSEDDRFYYVPPISREEKERLVKEMIVESVLDR